MKFKSLFLAALVAATLTSCDNSDDVKTPGIENPAVIEGVKTYAKVNLSFPRTKATENATGVESAITHLTLYIFRSSGLLEQAVEFNTTDITAKSKIFEITSGTKNVYAAVNIPAGLLAGITPNTTTKTQFEQKLLEIASISDMTTNNSFWMTNVDGAANCSLAPNVLNPTVGTNDVTVQVGRASAKIRVALSPSVNVLEGSADDLQFKVHNNPKDTYLMPVFAGVKRTTPYFNDAIVDGAKYLNAIVGDFNTIDQYASENMNVVPKEGNATFALIRLEFTPTVTLDANGENPVAGVKGSDFWRIRKGAASDYAYTDVYYRTEPSFDEVNKAGAGAQFVKYTDGMSFYKIYVADNSQTLASDKYSTMRNNLYNISIVNINGAGANTEEGVVPGDPENPGTDPETPLEQTTNMLAQIEILPWNVIDQAGGI